MSKLRYLFLVLAMLLLAACSTTVTGPITGKNYNLDIGCTDDMQAYKREREEAVGKDAAAKPVAADSECPGTTTP
jgi:outer membrane biogenesis lipoprotein LolB